MLLFLSIRDVVLIDRLDLALAPGLTVFTGETGAGKSILLDCLGLALGGRGDAALVRRGAAQAVVSVAFALPAGHSARSLLETQGIGAAGDTLLLRRTIAADGRSRAFVNDEPTSIGLLRRIGEQLAEIHGQFENQGLLDPASHRGVLDAFGRLDGTARAVATAWTAWRAAIAAREQAERTLAAARAEEAFVRHAAAELDRLAPEPGEEVRLAERRAAMMHREKLIEALNAALEILSRAGPTSAIQTARRALERVVDKADGRIEPIVAALDRADSELDQATALLQRAGTDLDLDGRQLEAVEERLFALRAAARKHGVDAGGLAELRQRLAGELAALAAGGDELGRLGEAERSARAAYVSAARALSRARGSVAVAMDNAVAAELPPLKLDKARFRTAVTVLDEADWGPAGLDRVAFEVTTNPGGLPGPLTRLVSGGELARFMLALKVVLSRIGNIGTIVFDEVDSGVGGAVAAAVGDRLNRLAGERQVLVVTHSPQVAAKGRHHWRVIKRDSDHGGVATLVEALDPLARREEIARMLAGARITDQARAAADSLLEQAEAT